MNMSDLRPAQEFAQKMGMKSIIYSGPGEGKTPISAETSPRPVVLLCEAGTLSLRKLTAPAYPAFTPDAIDGFFAWFLGSAEAKNFDTLIIDSVSQMAVTYLLAEEAKGSKAGNDPHGMKVYGAMAKRVMKHMSGVYFMPQKHIIGIAKQEIIDVNGIALKRPSFPGKVLPIEIPHLFDAIFHLGSTDIPGHGRQKVFRCQGSYDTIARDRSGMLAEYEPPNVQRIIQKFMS